MRQHHAKGSLGLPFALLALAAALPGCASDGADHDVAELRRDLSAAMTASQRARVETEAQVAQVDRRNREQAAETSRQLAGLSGRLDTITAELTRLSTRLEDVSHRVEALRVTAARAPAPPPRPPATPPVASTASPAPTVAPSPAVTPGPPAAVPPATTAPQAGTMAGSAERPPVAAPVPPGPLASPAAPAPSRTGAGAAAPEEAYQAAFGDLSRGRYPLAVQGFREFLRRYPDSPLADSAQHGIGEAYFSMARVSTGQGQTERARREWEQAVLEFRKVTVNYPRAGKVPTALYKEALALAELKQTALAQVRLRYLVDNFPQSAEAPLARERLAALKP